MDEILEKLFGIGSVAGGGLLTKSAYDRLQSIGEQAVLGKDIDGQRIPGSLELAQEALGMSQFRPFTVTTATGGRFGVGPSNFVVSETDDTLTLRGPSGDIPVLKSDPRLAGLSNEEIYKTVFGAAPALQAGITLSPAEQQIQQSLMTQAQQGLGGVVGAPSSQTAGLRLMGRGRTLYEQDPFGLTQQQQAAQQAFGLGGQFMGQAGMMPADVQALRQQYGQLAGQAAGDVLTPTAQREADVFERIRATQRPEEQRQRLALEERLAQQGRLGVRTAMFGGTPEQLALSQAQEEAQNRASLMAMQQAQAERQQALGTAQTLGGMFGQQASLASALQAQQAGLGAQFAGLGSGLAAQRQALGAAQQQQALQSLAAGQGLLSGGLGLQQAQQQLALGALAGSYVPQAQLLNVQQAAQLYPQLQQQAQLFGAGQYGETMMSGLEARLIAEQARANLLGGLGTGLFGGMFSPVGSKEDGYVIPFLDMFKGD
jgi:hypothetical protein